MSLASMRPRQRLLRRTRPRACQNKPRTWLPRGGCPAPGRSLEGGSGVAAAEGARAGFEDQQGELGLTVRLAARLSKAPRRLQDPPRLQRTTLCWPPTAVLQDASARPVEAACEHKAAVEDHKLRRGPPAEDARAVVGRGPVMGWGEAAQRVEQGTTGPDLRAGWAQRQPPPSTHLVVHVG
jgi:hypothetical protein